jgi:hypothetical protein
MTTEKQVTLPPGYDDLYAGVALFDLKAGAVLDANDWGETSEAGRVYMPYAAASQRNRTFTTIPAGW